ncbi:MAG: T9SS type A sorting domain-containing protein [Fibrobacteraceae bacterium]|nr:T9SS type A sorting domain-containing protein [Fibrobacteraceae bacterium]
MNLSRIAAACAMALGLSHAAVNYPFPQMSNYGGNATLLSDKAKASEELKKAFEYWLKDMYNENGDVAGVRSNPGSDEYFSEGVGYGMLLMVYFSDNTTSYQPQFDKIWNLYKKMSNENGLMVWKITNLSNKQDQGAALDGDIDAAAALVQAYYQFGDEKYLTEAKNLIQSMKKFEFESNGLHLPGDKWGDAGFNRKNPGYFDPAYMPLFAKADPENASFWSETAYDMNMKLYESSSNEVSTGLIDDWTDKNGKSEDDYYSYDASRAPWRNAKAVCWHGDQRALAIDKKIGKWASTISADRMSGPIIRSKGELGGDHNSTFITSIMTSLISDPTYQTKLDEYWAEAVKLGNENYFNQSLKLLNGLLVSGNMPDLSNMKSQGGGEQGGEQGGEGPSSAKALALAQAVKISVVGRELRLSGVKNPKVSLFDLNGGFVRSVQNSLQGVASGVYMVKVVDQGKTYTQRINLQ